MLSINNILSTKDGKPVAIPSQDMILGAVKLDGANLYDYWVPKLTTPLLEDVRKVGGIMVNLASMDIQGALKMDELRKQVRVITPEFQEWRDGKYETVRTYAKIARGMMTRYIVMNRVEEPEELKAFNGDGYTFNADLSDEEHYFFTRIKK